MADMSTDPALAEGWQSSPDGLPGAAVPWDKFICNRDPFATKL